MIFFINILLYSGRIGRIRMFIYINIYYILTSVLYQREKTLLNFFSYTVLYTNEIEQIDQSRGGRDEYFVSFFFLNKLL